jgi:hypothetical protein
MRKDDFIRKHGPAGAVIYRLLQTNAANGSVKARLRDHLKQLKADQKSEDNRDIPPDNPYL